MTWTMPKAHNNDKKTSAHHNVQSVYTKGFPPKPFSAWIPTAILIRVVAPMGYVARKRLCVGWCMIVPHISGNIA